MCTKAREREDHLRQTPVASPLISSPADKEIRGLVNLEDDPGEGRHGKVKWSFSLGDTFLFVEKHGLTNKQIVATSLFRATSRQLVSY